MRWLVAYSALATPADLLPRAHDDTPLFLYPLAPRSCLAHLLKLVSDGRAQQQGDRFCIA